MPFKLRTHSRNVHSLKFQLRSEKTQQSILLVSDLHWDNPHCDRGLLKEHFDEAKRRDSPIIVVGDSLCLMEGAGDPRGSRNLRIEHCEDNYLDAVIDTAAEWFEPYKNHLAVIGLGNHETSVQKRMDTCVISRLCQLLQTAGGITQEGGYGGWVRFHFKLHAKHRSDTLYYHHGFGGASPTTKGINHFNSHYLNQIQGADIIAAGHVHTKLAYPIRQAKLNKANRVEQTTIHCMRLGTYKDEYQDGATGWHVEKGRGARPLGGYFLNYTFQRKAGLKRSVEEMN